MNILAIVLPQEVSSMRKALVIAVVSLFVSYLLMINHLAIAGHTMQDLNKKIQTARYETDQLKEAVFRLESLSSIQKQAQDLNMVPVGSMRFLSSGGGKSVAQR
ncbi:MAG: hypothetical protein A3H59_03210 [Candidatus Jacksonbacteria bacterium RIFCSPLOWO2_02_FULL_43_9]|nr:MAG: hypothetical protein UV70_C0008G0034 [Parcubacteria group bacterium GW2011_GWA2_43_13]OGY69544.1 MAG: hypothetical protein A3B94_03815 [Candidatus Jacksonbacteria bacterium RIFCSPHIGHO2_02_FULL_43_10]OGY70261.1 MAG: hypothetical protein A2986_04325 [Candidatus Jacksonbacteria bacterium RIFCSPLOWO2_01_FULL_44_13]OGY72914.1 MAG: hypothetical protein A3H59_03210 [Candidatus Jacksonbacteria bacterium RIFCSPLOWO2_02_FULL_43_9]HAZ16971.1 hypothetical protein [Candidatus Jacksonbacteria bacter